MTSQISVTSERVNPFSLTLIIDGNTLTRGVSENGSTFGEVLNAMLKETGQDARVVERSDDGSWTLNNEILVVRNGMAQPAVTDGNVEVLPGDAVVVGEHHDNG